MDNKKQCCKNCEFSMKWDGFLICKRFSFPALELAITDIPRDECDNNIKSMPKTNFAVSPRFCCNRWLERRERFHVLDKEDEK